VRCSLAVILVVVLGSPSVFAQESVDLEMVSRIRDEAFQRSHVEDFLREMTDGIGPRLTNSPQMRAASEWAMKRFEEMGLSRVRQEGFYFGNGWSFAGCRFAMVEPVRLPLSALPLAWTPGTDGVVRGTAVFIGAKKADDLKKHRGKLAGKILFLDPPREPALAATEVFQRHDDASLDALCHSEIPDVDKPSWRKRARTFYKLMSQADSLGAAEGALAIVRISSRDAGIIRGTFGGDFREGNQSQLPALALSAKDYNRIVRHLKQDEEVALEFSVEATFHTEDPTAHNTIAELPGRSDELVLTGAHLDSWHMGTGATDDGAGCAVVMEAARILTTLDVQPRRTIRFILWAGEEQGLVGSRAYVNDHFASRPPRTPLEDYDYPDRWLDDAWPVTPHGDHDRLSAYFNLDNGGGRVRGIYAQGNAAVVPIFQNWLEPFADLGVETVTMRDTGGTDHLPFDAGGLPGFQFIQDGLEYRTRTHHTDLDVFEHVPIADMKQSAAVLATFLYHTAQREEMLPRKPVAKEPRRKPDTDDEASD